MSFFGGYSKRGRQLEEQDKKFLEFKKQMSDQNIVFKREIIWQWFWGHSGHSGRLWPLHWQ